jgi:hypothetical protein
MDNLSMRQKQKSPKNGEFRQKIMNQQAVLRKPA